MEKSYEIILAKVKDKGLDAKQINTSKDAYDFSRQFYFDDIGIYESMFMIVLNRNHIPIGWSKLSQGGTCGCTVDIKILCKIAIDSLASAVILVHNHPSGNLKESKEDDNITKKAKEALSLFDIILLDHIIITEDNYSSYVDKGKL